AGEACWAWARVELNSIQAASGTMGVTPRTLGDGCESGGRVQFPGYQRITLEECVSIYWSAGSVWRSTATSMQDELNPVWAPASELGRNFTGLSFQYYDRQGNLIVPSSLAARLAIAQVEVKIVLQTATVLSTGQRQNYELSARPVPLNLRLR